VPVDKQPTVLDLLETLDIMRNEPERFTYNPEDAAHADAVEESAKDDARLVENYTDSSFTTEADVIRSHARDLILGLRAFQKGGKYDMLARHTEVDIAGADMVYLDLEADEMEDDTGLMMQLLFNMVYERAKEEEKNVVFAIDEAHVLMDDDDTLGMLARAVRHARHYNLSINFITQQPADFFKNEKAKVIADNCTIKLIHQTSGLDERTANAIGLSPSLAREARGLRTGKRKGDTLFGSPYSEGLLYVSPYGWVPLYVSASPVEAAIVDAEITDKQELVDHLYRVDNTR
jgi:type IV secretory pathway VirB4 component